MGFWLDVPKKILDMMNHHGIHPAEAIHAAEHAFLNRFAFSADLGTECKAAEKEYSKTNSRKRPARYAYNHFRPEQLLTMMRRYRLIFYERSGKAGGIATKAFDHGQLNILCHQSATNSRSSILNPTQSTRHNRGLRLRGRLCGL